MSRRRPVRSGLAVLVLGGAGILVWGAVRVAGWERPLPGLGALAQGGRSVGPAGGVRQLGPNDCGPAALAHCLRGLGTHAPYPDPETAVRLGPKGCGFAELIREAARHGRSAVHRKTDPAHPEALLPYSVLYFRRGHFVAYERRDPSGAVLVHDPALGRIRFTPEALARQWTGDFLAIGRGDP